MMSKSAKSAKSRESKRLYSDSYMATLHNHDEKMRVFCEDMEKHGSQASACKAAGIDRGTSTNWKKKYPEFAQAWHDAFQNRLDALEKALFKRGVDTSDRAAFGMLKAHRRETYGDKVEVTHKDKIVLGWPEGEKGEA